MKIGIIGCGYVGKAAAICLKNKGHYLSVTTRQPERIQELQSAAHQVYLIKQEADYASFLAEQEALLISVAPDAASDYLTTYLKTAESVIHLLPRAPHLRQIIYTSSTSVYGEHNGEWVDENTIPSPSNLNARILLDTENLLLSQSSKALHVSIFRLGEIHGPGRSIEERLKRTHHKVFAGTGDQYTNLIHLDEILQAIELALSKNLNGIFNLCNDFHLPRKVFYEMICKKLGLPSIRWDEQLSSTHGGNKRVSNQKIKNLGLDLIAPEQNFIQNRK